MHFNDAAVGTHGNGFTRQGRFGAGLAQNHFRGLPLVAGGCQLDFEVELIVHEGAIIDKQIAQLESEKIRGHRELQRSRAEVRKLVANTASGSGSAATQLGDLNERIRIAEQRLTEIQDDSLALSRQMVSTQEVTDALAALDPVWETLAPKEQARIVRLLVERVEYDGEKGKVTMTFRPSGLRALGEDLIREEAAA